MSDLHNRRTFLRAAAAASATWAIADLVDVEDALAFATEQAASSGGARLSVLTQTDVAVLDALTTRILPSVDGKPGAREAGVVYFIDRALATFNAGQKVAYANGIRDLNRRATTKISAASNFAALTSSQQD